MALMDANLIFSNNVALTATAVSSVIDLAGFGVGVAEGGPPGPGPSGTANLTGLITGNRSTLGADMGIGDGVAIPKVTVYATTSFTAGGTSLNIQIQGAPDSGTGTEGTYQTYGESGAILVANLVQSAINPTGELWAIDLPKVIAFAGNTPPRFLRLNYLVTAGPLVAGKVLAGIFLSRSSEWAARQAANNYIVAA